MTRRTGQNPKVRIGKRADGTKYFFFQYWMDIPGQEERERRTEVVGVVGQLTRSEAERRKLDFVQRLEINSSRYQIPSSQTFADAVEHYREEFAPDELRDSTRSVAEGRIKNHLEADWNDVPVEHIDIKAVNKWARGKREAGFSWTTIKDSLRTMQRVLSAFSGNRPPFSMRDLKIPQREKLAMQIASRQKITYPWQQAEQIAMHIRYMDGLGPARREQYATMILLAAASGLRCSELLALRVDDVDFQAGAIRVDESLDRHGKVGPCKNAAAYRTVVLGDGEGQSALAQLRRFMGIGSLPRDFVFRSKRGGPLMESTILSQGLYPALRALAITQSGLHAFRRGCNRRWELAGINPAVIRQQMGHSSAAMTALYTGEIPLESVAAAFSKGKKGQMENMENEVVSQVLDSMERPMRIELTPEPWQGSVLPLY